MKKEFYNIANLVTKNAKILDVGVWEWRINEIYN